MNLLVVQTLSKSSSHTLRKLKKAAVSLLRNATPYLQQKICCFISWKTRSCVNRRVRRRMLILPQNNSFSRRGVGTHMITWPTFSRFSFVSWSTTIPEGVRWYFYVCREPGVLPKHEFDPRGVLPYMGYIGMCGPEGYGFSAVLLINRVSI